MSQCSSQSSYYCYCIHPLTGEVIADGFPPNPCQNGCTSWCSGSVPFAQEFQCPQPSEPTEGAYNCGDWVPDDYVSGPISNNYSIELDLISTLQNDPTPIFACDTTRVDLSDDVLEITSASSTDMAYLLGLRNGDVLVEVNGMPLDTPTDVMAAYYDLWVEEGELEYTLTILRGSSNTLLYYSVIPTI